MIKQIDVSDIPGRKVPYNNQVTLEVEQFHKSEWSACEVSTSKYKNVESARGAYNDAIRNAKVGVKAIVRDGRLFLIRR